MGRPKQIPGDLTTGKAGYADSIAAGVTDEIPLTNDANSLMQERVTVDLVWKF